MISPRDNAYTNKHALLWTIREEFLLCTKRIQPNRGVGSAGLEHE